MILPEGYQQVQSLPEDPEGSVSFGKQTESAICLVTLYQIPPEQAMPFNDKDEVINGIHRALAENQALVEVNAGRFKGGFQYIYSIVKTYREEGVQYFLLLHYKTPWYVVAISAYFSEYGITGVRDATVYELFRREHPDFGPDEWFYDPYDPNWQADYKMNVAEQEKYDELFPDHPLSQCRALVKHFIDSF